VEHSFLFTDIEDSTKKWDLYPEAMKVSLNRHDILVGETIASHSGTLVKHTGDGLMAVFRTPDVLECAFQLREALEMEDWSGVDGLHVKIGISTGEAEMREGDYFGTAVNRAARIASAAWGGQILLDLKTSETAALPSEAVLADRGVHWLKGLLHPVQVLSLEPASGAEEFPPLKTLSAHSGNLPEPSSPFMGREAELARIRDLLEDPSVRLVTLLGPGGAGKTRTAIRAAGDNAGMFIHGAWFVPLEDAGGAGEALEVLAESLSIRLSERESSIQRVISFLKDREILLVIDNFEQLVNQGSFITEILSGAPEVKVLTTSRFRLGLPGEHTVDLEGFSGSDDYGRDLFIQAAMRGDPSFTDNSGALEGICRLLDGLPLALELAASWVRVLPCEDILRELTENPHSLHDPLRQGPERHRSMKAAFMYTWHLLSEERRLILTRLSVFEGGFTAEAAQSVAGCGAVPLLTLLDMSIIQRIEGGRFSMHPATRTMVWELVPRRDEVLSGHAEFFLDFIGKRKKELSSRGQGEALDGIALEYPNLRRAALSLCGARRYAEMHVFVSAISLFLQLRSRFTGGTDFFSDMLEALDQTEHGEKARLLERMASFLLMSGRVDEAESTLAEAERLSKHIDDPVFRTLCLAGLGNISYMKNDYETAEDLWERALGSVPPGDREKTPSLLCNIASARKSLGRHEEALEALEQAAALLSGSEDAYLLAAYNTTMADVLRLKGDSEEAEKHFRKALELGRRTGNARGVSFCLESLAGLMMGRSPSEALPLAEEALEMALKSGARTRIDRAGAVLNTVRAALERH